MLGWASRALGVLVGMEHGQCMPAMIAMLQ
jgi:hypothetical protein